MESGKISVIMGIYNCADTLPAAIESIISQTYTNWELIMCDDCSIDNTYVVAEHYSQKYPDRIILIHNEHNMRLAYSLNRCLQYADGEYIARMDGDDMCSLDRFEKQVAYLKTHPELDLVGTAMQRFDETGVHDIVYAVDKPDRYTLRRRIPFHHATILTYKYVFDKLNGYTVSERTKRAQDYDLWFRFYHESFSGDNLREALYFVREDPAAIRRRTFSVRYNAFKTTIYGFKLLNYPKWWLARPFLVMILKSAIPFFVMDWYRIIQAERQVIHR